MNYIAIDFETANEKRNSPCSIGIVVVKNGKVIDQVHHFIKPKDMRFLPINIGIHGIRPSMVENEPEFDCVWEKIKHYFDNSLVIAHNAAFDISVLRKSAELYGIELPCFSYICTMKLSRNFYTKIENAKLNTVNRFLGYEFKHHDALYDALACSNILLNICEELKCDDIHEISQLLSVTIGSVEINGYKPSSTKGNAIKVSNRIERLEPVHKMDRFRENTFKDEVVVFTGRLASMSREEAMMLVRKLGGASASSVTKKTTIIVSNMIDFKNLRPEEMSNKFRRATFLKKEGQKIIFLNEEEFINMGQR